MKSERILEIIRVFPPLKSREPRFKRPPEYQGSSERTYDWLVNVWIPSQPDFEVLVELTIALNFHMGLVVAALMGEEIFEREILKLAEKQGIVA